VVAPSPGELHVAEKRQDRAVEGEVEVPKHVAPGLFGLGDQCLVAHGVDLVLVALVGPKQVLDPIEQVHLETVEVPLAAAPRLYEGGHHRKGVSPEKEVPAVRKEGDDLVRNEMVAGGLIEKVARSGR
jgi:hypothetical protein